MLELEVRKGTVTNYQPFHPFIEITPNINEDYWLLRVKVGENQYIQAFPKFGTIGIGFSQEIDWNTNLPFSCNTEEIYNHIKINKGNTKITKKNCITAIQMLQNAIKEIQDRE